MENITIFFALHINNNTKKYHSQLVKIVNILRKYDLLHHDEYVNLIDQINDVTSIDIDELTNHTYN